LAALADGEVFETEYRVRQRDGSYRWLRSRVAALSRTASGQLQRVVGVTQDITDRKRAEEALRESEKRLRSYFQLGLIGMAITAPAKGILEVNDEICRILGYERDELLQMTWAGLTHPDDLAADLLQFNRVMAGEVDGYSLDKRFIRKDGAMIDATISVKCVRTADGAVDYFVALLQDITERTRTNEALTQARDDLERRVAERTARLSALNDGLLRLHEFSGHQRPEADLQQILHDALMAVIAMHGADFGNVQCFRRHTAALEIVAHHGFGQEFLDDFNAVADDSSACGRAHQLQQRVIVEDVQTDPGFAPHRAAAAAAGFRAVQSTPIASRSGEPLGIISTHFRQPHRPSDETLRLTDLFATAVAEVIERKRSEAALLEYQRELQEVLSRLIEAQETASKYVARELHDVFSQKLAMIGRELASVERRAAQSPQALGSAIREITERMHTLAGDLHQMSRRIHPAILDDLGLPAAVRTECVAFAEEHHLPVAFEADDIRAGIPEAVALCLYRVAQEALRNVRKHAGVSSVHVTLRRTTTGLALTVDDTGKGFAVDTIAGKRGLGLVSMEERLRMVGGTLTIRSKPGDGTSVAATVPLST
jgi:PAS domain S-box-containing protein